MKKLLLLASVAAITYAQTPVITPSAPTAQTGQSVSLVSSIPVTWSLVSGSAGTLTTVDSTHATYHAPPNGIKQGHMMGGCQVMPLDSIWQTRIDALPALSQSATMLTNSANGGSEPFSPDFGWTSPSIADGTETIRTFADFYHDPPSVTYAYPWPSPARQRREGGTMRGRGPDHHTIEVRPSDCTFYEFYGDFLDGLQIRCNNDSSTANYLCNVQASQEYAWSNYADLPGDEVDKAALVLAPLTLTLDEVRDGTIHHAMRFTSCQGCFTTNGNVPYWPAHDHGWGPKTDLTALPFGGIVRLKATVTAARICGTGTDPTTTYCTHVVDALHNYGLVGADFGSIYAAQVSSDITEDPAAVSGVQRAFSWGQTNYEVVDTSSLKIAANTYRVNPLNGTETPDQYAVVHAVPTGGGTAVDTPIPLQPIGIGFYDPQLNMASNVSSYKIPYWVTGTTNKAVTWSLVQSAGAGDSVTADGVYTPPTSVTAVSVAILKVTSQADTSISKNIYVDVIPVGANPAGTIRMDAGRSVETTDTAGNKWWQNVGSETGIMGENDNLDYPSWKTTDPAKNIYESYMGTDGWDIIYRFIVPNGNYMIRLMFGISCNLRGCPYPGNIPNTFTSINDSPMMLEAQGQVDVHDYDFGNDMPGHATQQPADRYIPARVTDNTLVIALRGHYSDAPGIDFSNDPNDHGAAIAGLAVMPDATPAHWSIDVSQGPNTLTPHGQLRSINAGQTLQCYQVDWYSGLKDVQWSINGPGSIDQNGLYTAPAATPTSDAIVVIKAQSASNPSLNATYTITIPGSAFLYH